VLPPLFVWLVFPLSRHFSANTLYKEHAQLLPSTSYAIHNYFQGIFSHDSLLAFRREFRMKIIFLIFSPESFLDFLVPDFPPLVVPLPEITVSWTLTEQNPKRARIVMGPPRVSHSCRCPRFFVTDSSSQCSIIQTIFFVLAPIFFAVLSF